MLSQKLSCTIIVFHVLIRWGNNALGDGKYYVISGVTVHETNYDLVVEKQSSRDAALQSQRMDQIIISTGHVSKCRRVGRNDEDSKCSDQDRIQLSSVASTLVQRLSVAKDESLLIEKGVIFSSIFYWIIGSRLQSACCSKRKAACLLQSLPLQLQSL